MQEEIDREAIAVAMKASKLTAQTLAQALAAVARKIRKERREAQIPRGRQSVEKLMSHNAPTSSIPIEGDKGLFDKVARKWNVDYAFHRTGRKKYLLMFKTGQADAITAAFSEYSKRVMKRAKDKRLTAKEQIELAAEQAGRENPKSKERQRTREAARE